MLQSEIDRAFHLRGEFFWLGPLRDRPVVRHFCHELLRPRRRMARPSLRPAGRQQAGLLRRGRNVMRTLFLQAPSFDGFDGGAGSRYQARREIRSFWYPTWLAQPAALVEGSKLIDAPPHGTKLAEVTASARDYDLVVLHTSAPSFASDVATIKALKAANSALKIGLVGAKVAVDPAGTPERLAADRFRRAQRVRLHHQGGRRRTTAGATSPACPIAIRRASSSTTTSARSWKTWTACRSSRRSTSATSTSRIISSAI